MTLYDRIGRNYTRHRSPDPSIAARIDAAIGQAATVVNVGAGAGSYEPDGAVAVEPSSVMVAQRASANPVVAAYAENLPFASGTFEVAMAVLSVHHWNDQPAGLREMRRVAGRCVIFSFDIAVLHDAFWLVRDYVPEFREMESHVPLPAQIAEIVGAARVDPVPLPADCRDGFLAAYWARPESFLDPSVRSAISLFHRLDATVVRRMVTKLSEDLASGRWERRNADLRGQTELDLGFRLIA